MKTADDTRKAIAALRALATELRNDALEEYARDLDINGPDAGDAPLMTLAASPLVAMIAGDILSMAGAWGNEYGLRPESSTRRDIERMHHAARVAVQLLDLYLAATGGV